MSLFDSPLIQVALGLAFLYFALALAVLGVNEAIARKLGWRAECLWRAIKGLLGHEPFAKDLYAHHLVSGITEKPDDVESKPSYIPGTVFATALVDEIGLVPPKTVSDVDSLLAAKGVSDPAKKGIVALANSSTSIEDFSNRLAHWFDAAMDRASGWYRRKLKAWSFYLACLVVIGSNADTIRAGSMLWRLPDLRQKVVAEGKAAGAQTALPAANASLLQAGDLPSLIGWNEGISFLNPGYAPSENAHLPTLIWRPPLLPAIDVWRWLIKVMGLMITIGLVSLGAPFWFDVLNRFGSISSSGSKPPPTAKG